jgi:hypothetical protein
VNEQRRAAYERVIDADQLIAEARYPCGISQDAITEALLVADPDDSGIELESDVSRCILGRHVPALGVGPPRAWRPGCSAVGCGTRGLAQGAGRIEGVLIALQRLRAVPALS